MDKEIRQLYNECLGIYEACTNNRDRINHILSSFVAGTSILNSMDVDEVRKLGPEIELPGTESEYDYSIKIVTNHIESLDKLHEKAKALRQKIDSMTMTQELLKIYDQIIDWMKQAKQDILDYENIIQKLKTFKEIIFERDQNQFMKNVDTSNVKDTASSFGGGGGGGSTGGGGGATSASSSAPSTQPPKPVEIDLGDYTPAVTFPDLKCPTSLKSAESNLSAHAVDVGKILSNCVINGQVIGAGVYPLGDIATNTSDIGCDFMALQLSLDYVKADIDATQAYIDQMKTSIENNKAKISEYQAKMKATKLVADYDEKGRAIGYHEEPLYNHGVLQTAIDTLEAQNTALEGKIDHYNAEKIKKTDVFNQLADVRNTYNRVYDGLVNVFTAVDGLNAVSSLSDAGALYGLTLTDTQKQDLFGNLKMTLESNQDKFTLVQGDYDVKKGEFSVDQFKYLLESCALLSDKAAGSFADNVNTWREKEAERARQAQAETKPESEKLLLDEEKDTADPTKAEEEKEDSTLDQLNKDLKESAATSTSTVNPTSNVELNPEVERFLLGHKGETVVIDSALKQQLGLQNTGLISIPDNYDPNQSYPFLLWLVGTGHSAGSAENLKTDAFAKTLINGNYENKDAIIYIPTGWGNGEANSSKYSASQLNHDLDQMLGNLNVDQNRISGAGTSIGAFALAYLTTSHPDLFSTVALTGGGYEGGPNHGISVQDAIQASPNTTYIWYVSNSDNSSHIVSHGQDTGIGVYDYSKEQHEALQQAGVNSVFYDVGGIGHSNACARFATEPMMHDLTTHVKGDPVNNLPTDVQYVTPQETVDTALSGGHNSAPWYIPIST